MSEHPSHKTCLRYPQKPKAGLISLLLMVSVIVGATAARSLADEDGVAERQDALQAIQLLQQKCWACHGVDKQEGSLRLDSRAAMLQGGDRGPAIVVDRSATEESWLLRSVRGDDESLQMPPKMPLSKDEVAILERWIERGAPWPDVEPPSDVPSSDDADQANVGDAFSDSNNPIRKLFGESRLGLWSLRPIDLPALPLVRDVDWPLNPIDHFVLSQWERDGRRPIDEVDPRTFALRSSMDLVGLPPGADDVESFVLEAEQEAASSAESAYDRWMDRLLSSPDYGIHVARMWLDVVRYSDSNGFDWDEYRLQAWRYRDYVIRALNRDEPYDHFIRQQLAGDELLDGAPKSPVEQDGLIATGYLRLGPHDNAAPLFNEQDRSRAELMADLTETTASGLLGLTMSCCRCHDHKTEPLSQADHYRLRDFFVAVRFSDDVPLGLESEQSEINAHNAAVDAQMDELEKRRQAIEQSVQARIASAQGGSNEAKPSEIDAKALAEHFTEDEKSRMASLESELSQLRATRKSHQYGMLMKDQVEKVPETYVLYQGDHKAPRQPVRFGYPSVLFPGSPALVGTHSENTTGRRLTLANWIASERNPWAARVIVNRLWLMHFGRGIVDTPNDFGLSGTPPSNGPLLDWLASELIRSGWSLKHIQRLIVTSRVYRLRAVSQVDREGGVASMRDTMRRKSAEQLRDSMLAVSGLLQNRSGGKPVWPELDPEILQANPAFLDDNETKTKGWYPSPDTEQTVRSIFLIQKRTVRVPWMETFDLPENSASCPCRESSIVAPQALSLMNGSWSQRAAEGLAKRIREANDESDSEFGQRAIQHAFRLLFQRSPRASELESCRVFLQTRSLEELCLVLLNTNEFAFIE